MQGGLIVAQLTRKKKIIRKKGDGRNYARKPVVGGGGRGRDLKSQMLTRRELSEKKRGHASSDR